MEQYLQARSQHTPVDILSTTTNLKQLSKRAVQLKRLSRYNAPMTVSATLVCHISQRKMLLSFICFYKAIENESLN